MSINSVYLKAAAGLLVTAVLAGCAAQPATIAADDEMFCRYSEGNAGISPQCRTKLEARRVSMVAENASRIEGYALLRTSGKPTEIARRCKPDGDKPCDPADVTGTIPDASKGRTPPAEQEP